MRPTVTRCRRRPVIGRPGHDRLRRRTEGPGACGRDPTGILVGLGELELIVNTALDSTREYIDYLEPTDADIDEMIEAYKDGNGEL